MRLTFNNINACRLNDQLLANSIIPILVESDCNANEYIAKNTWVTLSEDVDLEKINEIVKNLNSIPVIEQTQEEKQAELINNLILDNLNMQTQLDELITNGLGGN